MPRRFAQRDPRQRDGEEGGDDRNPVNRPDIAREPYHQPDRCDRRKHRSDGIERLAQAEGAAADFGRCLVGDHGVARAPANALADSVDEARRHQRQGAARKREQRLGQSGEAIAGEDQRLAALAFVRRPARSQLGEVGGRLGDPVNRPERRRRKPENDRHEGRQKRVINLARQVHQQTDEAQDPDVAGQRRARAHRQSMAAFCNAVQLRGQHSSPQH